MVGSQDRRARLLNKFFAVAAERVQKLNQHLQHLEDHPDDDGVIAELMREIHSLKGDSHIVGMPEINKVSHRTEDILIEVRQRGFDKLTSESRERILAGFDLISELIEARGANKVELADRATQFVSEGASAAPAPVLATALRPPTAPPFQERSATRKTPARSPAETEEPEPEPEPPSPPQAEIRDSAPATSAQRSLSEDFVRVSGQQLSALTSLSGDLLVRQDQLERRVTEVGDIAVRWLDALPTIGTRLRDDAPAAEANGEPAPQTSAGARQIGELFAVGRELASTIARIREEAFENRLHLRRLQETIRGMRLLSVGALFDRYPRAVRGLARSQDKQVRVRVSGADVAVDKQVLDRLDEPLMHMLRNAVDHGLESPEERRSRGKAPEGEIWLAARQIGDRVELEIGDDGRGIDPAAVLDAARSRGIIDEHEASHLSPEDTLTLLFRPGFSTRSKASLVSGRGIGLDVVNECVDELGGAVQMTSEPGKGTRFFLRVPISVALTKALVTRAGGGLFALPSASIEAVLQVPHAEIQDTGGGRAIQIEGERIALSSLSELLEIGAEPTPTNGTLPIALIEYRGRRLALAVERFEGEREMLRLAVDPFLAGVDIVSGAAVLGDQRLALFLHLPGLLRRAQSRSEISAAPGRSTVRRGRKRVLCVDDSELTRVMLVSIIDRLGYIAIEAVNGAEALNVIARERPDLVLTDLDMPVLDGFGLIQRIREEPRNKNLPVVVMSTKGADEDKRRAMDCGANAYHVKTEFREEDLERTFELYLGVN